jgi:hypothetical protein
MTNIPDDGAGHLHTRLSFLTGVPAAVWDDAKAALAAEVKVLTRILIEKGRLGEVAPDTALAWTTLTLPGTLPDGRRGSVAVEGVVLYAAADGRTYYIPPAGAANQWLRALSYFDISVESITPDKIIAPSRWMQTLEAAPLEDRRGAPYPLSTGTLRKRAEERGVSLSRVALTDYAKQCLLPSERTSPQRSTASSPVPQYRFPSDAPERLVALDQLKRYTDWGPARIAQQLQRQWTEKEDDEE